MFSNFKKMFSFSNFVMFMFSENVQELKKCFLSENLSRISFVRCSCFNKCTGMSKYVHTSKICSQFQKNFLVSIFFRILENVSLKKFTMSKNIQFFKNCSRFRKLLGFAKNVHVSKSLLSIFENVCF